MKKSVLFASAMMLLAAAACNKEIQGDNPTSESKPQVELSFNASLTVPTKTEIGVVGDKVDGVAEHQIYWSKGDKIAVYPHDNESTETKIQGVEFTSEDLSDEAAAVATFTGTIDEADAYYAFYPASADATWSAQHSTFSVKLSHIQKANGIASGFAVANVSESGSVTFDHVCGFIKFDIGDDLAGKIKEVRISGNSKEPLVGYYNVYPEDMEDMTKNKIYTDTGKESELFLTPAEGNTFVAGSYYFTCLPTTLNGGLTITFVNSEDQVATKTSATAATIERAGILNLGTVADLDFEDVTPPLTDGDYAILVKVGENNYKALSSTASGTRLAAVDVIYDGSAEKLSVSDATAIWNFTNTSAKNYAVTNSNKYINHSSGNTANTTEEASECEVIDNGNGTYRVQLESDQLRYLAYNTSEYFAFYGTNTSCDYTLYLIPAEYVLLPTISVNGEPEVIASDDTASKEITIDVTDATSVSVKVYGEETLENEITWLTVSYADGKLTYSATENTEDDERVAYVVITASNANGQTTYVVEIIQSGSVSFSKYTLLSTDIANVGVEWEYTDTNIKSITAADASVWKVYQSYRTVNQNTVQLKIKSNPGYLLSPTTSSSIKKIDVTVKGGSNTAKLAIKSTSDVEIVTQTVTTNQTKYTFNLTGTDTAVKFTSSNGTINIQEVVIYY